MASPKDTSILLVDDEPLNLEIVMHTLEKQGYKIKCTGDAEQALMLLHNHPDDYDLLLLDRQLPGMNGLDLLKKIKQHDKLKNIPVIMQTALTKKSEIDEGIAAGAYYYLTKPFDGESLTKIVEAAVNDLEKENKQREELKKSSTIYDLVDNFSLKLKTLEDVEKTTLYLSNLFPDPERVSFGIESLLTNAIEHGNLDLGYFKKGELKSDEEWRQEIKKRLAKPENTNKFVKVNYFKDANEIKLVIEDQGRGFDFQQYLNFNPDRVTDNHGRGVAIANMRCFDKLEYSPPGNKVTATISLKDNA